MFCVKVGICRLVSSCLAVLSLFITSMIHDIAVLTCNSRFDHLLPSHPSSLSLHVWNVIR